MSAIILQGDWIDVLKTLPDASVHCVVTSPPYWGLRDYGTATWEGGDAACDHRKNGERRQLPHGDGRENDCYAGERVLIAGAGAAYSHACGKCGAIRIDQQLGLERTPEEYIARMVAGFREVRRVLRSDGVCWVNLGDSYASAPCGNFGPGMTKPADGGRYRENKPKMDYGAAGLKPKDLCGIPWRAAFALQQPYYTGRIKRIEDRVWLAAMIDAEGCIFIHKRRVGQNNGQGYERKSDSYGSGLEVANCSEAIVRRCLEITGIGSICTQGSEQNSRRKQLLYRWNVRSNECREILREVYPHLIAKQQQARLSIGCPSSGAQAEASHAALIGLHNGIASDVDFPAPPTMYESGWWLRQDNIWSKSNPMPESVTDRCTKSHEYIFLLTKAERYFYDAEAVKEDVAGTAHKRQPKNGNLASMAFKMQDPGLGNRNNSSFQSYMQDLDPAIGRNKRSVWNIATAAFPDEMCTACRHVYGGDYRALRWHRWIDPDTQEEKAARLCKCGRWDAWLGHFATFPPELPETCIKAGTSEHGCCANCGAPWERVVEAESKDVARHTRLDCPRSHHAGQTPHRVGGFESQTRTIGWQPTCKCATTEVVPCTVLDPFSGAGTTGLVATRLGRDYIGIELNPDYIAMSERRIVQDAPLFNAMPELFEPEPEQLTIGGAE